LLRGGFTFSIGSRIDPIENDPALEIRATPILFPIAKAGGFRAFLAADFRRQFLRFPRFDWFRRRRFSFGFFGHGVDLVALLLIRK
jgi:hypothetical protein